MKKYILPLILILSALIGVFSVNAIADEASAELDITGANLVFSEQVYMLFSVDVKNAPPEDVELLIFKGEGIKTELCKKGNETAVLHTSGKTVSDGDIKGYVFEYYDIPAAYYTENIYARAYYSDADGEYYSEVVKYSVLQYACNKLGVTGTATKNEKLRSMLENLLSYGASCQEYFGVNTSRLATDEYVKYYFEGATLPDGTSYGLYKKGERVTATAVKSASKPYTMWRDSNGSSVATGETLGLTADRNRTIIAAKQADEPTFGSYKYVVIIGVDGAGCFYPDETNTPNMDRIFKDGAKTYTMRVTSPSASSVSWMSCLHGVQPENHGNLENATVEAGNPYPLNTNYPSILRVVKETRPTEEVACFYAWSGINGIVESGVGINKQRKGDAAIVEYLESGYLKRSKPTLTYLHFNNPDAVGHNQGHLTEAYYKSIETIDTYVGRIYEAYRAAGMIDETLFIVTADHGGINKTHGGLHDTEKYVMFAAAGKNVTNTEIEDMYIRDTSAVVLHALGIEMPKTYTALIPTGIFADVKAGERFEYHDPTLPRYHLPEETPDEGSDGYVTNYVDNELLVYMPFDGTAEDVMGREVRENGKLTYEDGYFGKGIRIDDGYLNIEDFNFGTGSYTISMWVKSSTPTNGHSPILTNKRMSSGQNGFVFAIGRYASVERQDHYCYLNASRNSQPVEIKQNMPSDYIYGWMHVLLVLDRENGQLSLTYDFGAPITVDMTSAIAPGVSLDTAFDYLTIGEAPDGEASQKSGFAIDELMIFEGAFDNDDVKALAGYFSPDIKAYDKVDVTDWFDSDEKPDVYLDFEGYTGNGGVAPVTINRNGTIEYESGRVGYSAYLDSSRFVKIRDYSLGEASFSVAAWIFPTDLSSENKRERLPIISNAAGADRENYGFNIMIDTVEQKLVATVGQSGRGVEIKADFPSATYEKKWTHIAVVFDRDTNRLIIYIDFIEAADMPLAYYGMDVMLDPTLSSDSDYPITVGNFGAPGTSGSLKAYVDDLMIFSRALNSGDITRMYDFYKNPLSVYIEKSPMAELGFDESVESKNDGMAVTEQGNIEYSDGYIGSSMTVGSGTVELPELDLGADKSFTLSFFVSLTDFDSSADKERYVYILSNEGEDGAPYFTVKIDRKEKKIFVECRTGADETGYVLAPYTCDGEWMNVTVVLDRSADSPLKVYLDFERAAVLSSSDELFGIYDLNAPEGLTPHIGGGGVGDTHSAVGVRIDEVMIFGDALTELEVKRLGSYYNQLI